MSSVFNETNLEGTETMGSKLQIKAFEKGDPSPFKDIDYTKTNVYELTDYTLRTPLEKMDVFSEMLQLPLDCELWILPFTEETSQLLKELPKDDETYEKTASLFKMLSSVKDTVETDRSFIVAECGACEELIGKLEELGYTMKPMGKEELERITL